MHPIRQNITLLVLVLLFANLGFSQIYPVKSKGKWGLIDQNGNTIAKAEYDAIDEIWGDHAVVVQNSKYGLINSSGTQIVSCSYTFVKQLSDELILINQGGDCSNGDCKGGTWGIQNIRTRNRIDPQFDLITNFNPRGFALVNAGGKCSYADCEGGRWGIVDTLAIQLLNCTFFEIKPGINDEVYVKSESGWGIFDLRMRKMIIPPIHTELLRVNRTNFAVKSEQNWALLNQNGDTLSEAKYDALEDAGQEYVAYKLGNHFGLMDSLGRVLTAARFEKIQVNNNQWVTFEKDGRWGIADFNDSTLLDPILTEIVRFSPLTILAKRGNNFGMVDRKGEIIVPFSFPQISIINDSISFFIDRKFYKWVNHEGKILQSLSLDALEEFSPNHVAKAKYLGKWGLINWEGQWIIKPNYESVVLFRQAAKVKDGEDWQYYYFDEDGHPSTAKRIILVRDDEPEEPVSNLNPTINGPNGWFMNSSRLWGLRDLNSNQIVINPKFTNVNFINRRNLTAVKGKIPKSEDEGWGIVNNATGKLVTDLYFEKIYVRDFDSFEVARAVYHGSGKYALINAKGEIINIANAGYIGPFKEDIARVNVGGKMIWSPVADIDTIESSVSRNRITNEIEWSYQYCQGGKWGYVDKEGNWLNEPTYETALDFSMGVSRIRLQGKWGAINSQFKVIVKPAFDFIEPLFAQNGRTFFAVGENKVKVGFIDPKGEISITPTFDAAGKFHNGLVKIKQDGKWGFSDAEGNVVIAPQYAEAGDFYEGIARVRDKRYWGFIDSLGNPLTKQIYLRAGDFHEGLAWVQDGKFFGFLNHQGEMEIPSEFTALSDFSEGLAPAKRKGSVGLIDQTGKWVVSPKYYRIGAFHDSLAVVQEKGNFGLIDPRGDFVVKPVFREIADFSEGLAKYKKGLLYGYLDATGEQKINCQFPNAGNFSCGRAPIFDKGRWGYIDTTGQIVIEVKYPKVMPFSENLAAIRMGNRWGFLNPSGEIAVPISFDKVGSFLEERAPVYIEGQGWGFINPEGTLVIPCEYDEVGWGGNGIYSVRKDKKWGLINRFGAVMTRCKYDAIGEFSESFASVSRLRSLGVVDSEGRILLSPQYDNVSQVGTMLQVERDEEIGYIDLNGNWVWGLSK